MARSIAIIDLCYVSHPSSIASVSLDQLLWSSFRFSLVQRNGGDQLAVAMANVYFDTLAVCLFSARNNYYVANI
jgi:hypothetical protein